MSTSSEWHDSEVFGVRPFQYPHLTEDPETDEGQGIEVEHSSERERYAHESGLREGEDRARQQYETNLQRERTALAKAIGDFKYEREQYYQRVEAEVVQLALAIARKILHRESQLDPLSLSGLVHVALRKLADSTTVRLRVHPGQAKAWADFFAQSREEKRVVPNVVADDSVLAGACILETDLGTTELGMEVQLKEVEKGLFDLLAERPRLR